MKMTGRLAGMVLVGLVLLICGTARSQEKAEATLDQGPSKKLSVPLADGVKMDFVLIRPGSFMTGSEKGDADEKPVHEVRITKPFYMGVYEVTQAQWKALMGDNPAYSKGDDLPMEQVSWYDCQKFLAKLQEKVGQGLTCRLPTEAEWEYACRAGSKTEYCFGNQESALGEYAWYDGNSGGKPHPVGQKKPNAWGLYDMHGNVWEWCADWSGDYSGTAESDPKGPSLGAACVLRGGSWHHTCRDLPRRLPIQELPYDWDYSYGFRVVCEVGM